ncbi:MAG: inositol monophosphatase family protein [Pseudomonadota bacterium]
MKKDANSLLEIAVQATEIGKSVLKNNRAQSKIVNSEAGHDIKLDGDLISEKAIIQFLHEQTEFNIISEEAGNIVGQKDGEYWILDPIDGSLNYSRNIPISCISIALWKDNRPVLGVINDFNRGEIFSGIVGQGAWLDNKPVNVSPKDKVEDSILATGFPSKTDYSSKALSQFVKKVQNFKKIRLIGSASLSTAYVASGRFDAYMEKGIMLWDVAAGIAITVAGGGKYKMLQTENIYQYDVIVSNSNIMQYLEI